MIAPQGEARWSRQRGQILTHIWQGAPGVPDVAGVWEGITLPYICQEPSAFERTGGSVSLVNERIAMITPDWTDDQPIYRQLRDKVAAAIIEGALKEEEPLPSVRNIAVELQINPITASKAYQELVAEGLVERRRGLGMFIIEGARSRLLADERTRFLEIEWPRIVERIEALGLNMKELLVAATDNKGTSS